MPMKHLITALSLFASTLYAQDYQAVYQASIATAETDQWSGKTILVFNDTAATFYHADWPKDGDLIANDVGFKIIEGDSEYMKVYTNLKQDMLQYKSFYAAPSDWNFIFTDTIPNIAWEVSGEQRMIGDLPAMRATGAFGGRTYEAWYTPSIPTTFGPYYFSGLPGLILELSSSDGIVHYSFQNFGPRPADSEFTVGPPVDGKHIEMEDFEEHVINLLLKSEALSTADVKITNYNPLSDYEIIKDRWTIIKRYKEKRGY